MTPLPKRGFGPPSYGTFSTPLRRQCYVFPVQKSTTEQTRSSFGGVQNFSGERVLWYVLKFLPPHVLHPPHITAQRYFQSKKPAHLRAFTTSIARPWCLGEMCTARLKSVNTVLLALPSFQLPEELQSLTILCKIITRLKRLWGKLFYLQLELLTRK